MNHKFLTVSFVLISFAVLLSACAGQQTRTKSSVVDYLYPKGSVTTIQPSIPVLNLPIKVGIAFVPNQHSASQGYNIWENSAGAGELTEGRKMDLLEKVASNFRKLEFVKDIEVIPSAYLIYGGGFANLEQIKTMFQIDVIALVSYDQVQFTDEGLLSLTYWTLIGAYVFSGEKNDTSTMLDTAVYDIQSREMLFRAPGTSNVKGTATPVNLSENLRKDSLNGFNLAADEMIGNLDLQLNKFREKIKNDPAKATIIRKHGYSGGGSFGLFSTILLLLIFSKKKAHAFFINKLR